MIFHVERVAQARDTRELRRGDPHPRPREMFDNLSGRISLARIHTRAGDQYQWRSAIETLTGSHGSFGDVQNPAVAHRHPNHFDFYGIAQTVMMPDAFADQPPEIQQMQSIAGLHALWNIAYKTFESPSITEHTRDD